MLILQKKIGVFVLDAIIQSARFIAVLFADNWLLSLIYSTNLYGFFYNPFISSFGRQLIEDLTTKKVNP